MAIFGKKKDGGKGKQVIVAPVTVVPAAEELLAKLETGKEGGVVGLTSQEFQTLNQMRFIGPL